MNRDSVLIVDDNQMMRHSLKALLEDAGLSGDTCGDGMCALAKAKENRYSVFLIDYRMPEMTGDRVTALLRALRPDAFIIGFSLEDRERDFLGAGANIFLNKQHLLNKLVLEIRKAIHL